MKKYINRIAAKDKEQSTYTKDTVIMWLLIGVIIGMLIGYYCLYYIPSMGN